MFDAKRLIGRKFDESTVQSDMKHWPFTVIENGGKPKLQVEYKNEQKMFTRASQPDNFDQPASRG